MWDSEADKVDGTAEVDSDRSVEGGHVIVFEVVVGGRGRLFG
jgi:hypothetical protein